VHAHSPSTAPAAEHRTVSQGGQAQFLG
jgi:hypothetical protein